MFYGCESLIYLNLRNFNTPNVIKLESSILYTSSVSKMNSMFSVCNSLTSLDISNFNTKSVTSMEYMPE